MTLRWSSSQPCRQPNRSRAGKVYERLQGKMRNHSPAYTQTSITLAAAGARLIVDLRLANDSFAFRYRFPEADAGLRRVKEELTGFAVPAGSRGWLLQHDPPGKWTPAYENFFAEVAAGAPAPTSQGWSYPALFRLPAAQGPAAQWLLISEAAVDRHYAGTRLAAEAPGGVYRLRFPDPGEGLGQGDVEPHAHRRLDAAVAGDHHRRPGDSVCLDGGRGSQSPANGRLHMGAARPRVVRLVDRRRCVEEGGRAEGVHRPGGRDGLGVSLIDANWHLAPEGVIDRVVAYAREKKVGLWLWYNSAGPHNDVTEWGPRDRITTGRRGARSSRASRRLASPV